MKVKAWISYYIPQNTAGERTQNIFMHQWTAWIFVRDHILAATREARIILSIKSSIVGYRYNSGPGRLRMMTSSNGDISRVTGYLCGELRHKVQWRGDFMFSLIFAWTKDQVNNGEVGDLRRHRAHYDFTIMGPCVHIKMSFLTVGCPHLTPYKVIPALASAQWFVEMWYCV